MGIGEDVSQGPDSHQEVAMEKRIVFPRKQELIVEPYVAGRPGAGEVRVRSICSLMSTGTENIVLNQSFSPGTGWEKWVRYPFHPGYAVVGEIDAVGEGVTDRRAGDRVALRMGHASCHIVPQEESYPIPAGIDPREAAWFALAKITFMGALAAQHTLGGSVVVVGAGPIGQMSVRWARAAGVRRIIAVDPEGSRLTLARRGGATAAIAKPVAECRVDLEAANGGEPPPLVIDSTGNAKVFEATLPLIARFGTLVILGDTGTPAEQRLTQDVINNGLRIVGAHDCHVTAAWTQARVIATFFDLLLQGRMDLSGLNTHTFRPDEAADAYRLANTRRGESMGIVFAWS
jgi:2-desacetyl-2-hydroxyethyl bacteriochlorophyllide A dehydrogenase